MLYATRWDKALQEVVLVSMAKRKNDVGVTTNQTEDRTLYGRIYGIVRQIPYGRVATYGQIAAIVGRCTARSVGYAMAGVPAATDIPWYRVINSAGKISDRRRGDGSIRQRKLLEAEGVRFDQLGRVNFYEVGWRGPQ